MSLVKNRRTEKCDCCATQGKEMIIVFKNTNSTSSYHKDNVYICESCLVNFFKMTGISTIAKGIIELTEVIISDEYLEGSVFDSVASGDLYQFIAKNILEDSKYLSMEEFKEKYNDNNQKRKYGNKDHKDSFLSMDGITPKSLKKYLDDYIIGQDQAKKDISVSVFTHILRVGSKDSQIKKTNCLIVGPTGTGKTEMLNLLGEKLNIPFVKIDTTELTPNGYKGSDISSIFHRLLGAANGNLELAQKGIVLLDEIDKLSNSGSEASEVAAQIQKQILKVVEGGSFELKDGKMFDTTNVTFFAAGAFSGIEKLIEKKVSPRTLGLIVEQNKACDPQKQEDKVNKSHLIQYGIMPELLGRFSNVTYTNKLSESDLISILDNSKNSPLSSAKELIGRIGHKVVFSRCFIQGVAKESLKHNLGVRGLYSLVNEKVNDIVYDYAGDEPLVLDIKISGIKKKREKNKKDVSQLK